MSSSSKHSSIGTNTDTDIICFIGGGNMARSLIGGLVARGTNPGNIRVSEPVSSVRESLALKYGVSTFSDSIDAVDGADIVVLAVKPQVMRAVCGTLRGQLNRRALTVSIAAGIRSAQIDGWLGGDRAIVRVMPNTPALLGAGAAGLFANGRVRDPQRRAVERLVQATGIVRWVDNESRMDAVTALSGSGPAYVFLLAESMQAAAEAQGLDTETARVLSIQTVLGAARMLTESKEDAAELRRRVTSPGGTTQAAIESLEADGFRRLLDRAIDAATARGRSLSAEFDTESDD